MSASRGLTAGAIAESLRSLATPVDHLAPLPGNPRRGDVAAVARSYAAFGQRKPVVARRLSVGADGEPRGEVIAGNHQLAAARQLGWSHLAVVWVDDDEVTARAFALADNRTAELGGYDSGALAEMLASTIREAEPDVVAATGWTPADLDRLLDELGAGVDDARPDPDDVPAPPPEPRTRLGDLWLLGQHRLLCGDATAEADVGRLLGDETPTLLATDPPYGVELDQSWRDKAAGINHFAPGNAALVANDDRWEWTDAYRQARADVAVVWHAAAHACEVAENLTAAGFDVLQQLIWVKPHAALGRSYYHWRHEPAWLARRHGGSVSWQVGRDQTTVWEAASPKQVFGAKLDDKTAHPTQKPIALYERPIENHVALGGVVYDPFAGSGSAVIAAERLGRRARLMELEPRWCDLICARYQAQTGRLPIDEATGEAVSFDGQ